MGAVRRGSTARGGLPTGRFGGLDVLGATFHPVDGLVITTARAALRGEYGESAIDGTYAYTRLWSKPSGKWRVIAGHASALP